MTTSSSEPDVLVVGAGPTGLVLALWLTKLGARVRIVDKTAEPGTTSRALAVQARTLELYRQVGLADVVVDAGRKAVAVNLWVAGRQVGRAPFGNMGQGLSPYPYVPIYGAVAPELIALCGARGLPLHVFWRPTIARAGLTRNAAYLVRPDGYVALAEPEASAAKLKAYLDEWGVIAAATSSRRPASH
jgi:2-polyprenyl-6-methoxyphenol hydroxylase-like FAD-dependent oxidoreductase